jgi:hypothetical protein
MTPRTESATQKCYSESFRGRDLYEVEALNSADPEPVNKPIIYRWDVAILRRIISPSDIEPSEFF